MLSVSVDGSDVSSVDELNAEEKDSRKPNEGLHGVVEAERNGGKGSWINRAQCWFCS